MVVVSNVRVADNRLVGLVDGQEVTYTFPPSLRIVPRGEPFLALALFLGISSGSDVLFHSDAPLSPKLLEMLPIIQSLLKQWDPGFTRVRIHAPAHPVPRLNPGVLSAYSGGIDSSCTLVEHLDEITHVMTLNMFDEHGRSDATELFQKNDRAVTIDFGKSFLPIGSNVRGLLSRSGVPWDYGHGPFLCLLAAGLGFDKFYMASSYTYRELKPWGSHPVLDPLWSTETTQVIHDGAHHRRSEKTQIIASHPAALRNLQVCWNSKTANCGACAKCARTLIVLNMLGARGAPFPSRRNADLMPYLQAQSALSASFLWDIMLAARERSEREIAERVAARLRRYVIKSSLLRVVEQVVGVRAIARLKAWKSGRPTESARFAVRDPDSFIDS